MQTEVGVKVANGSTVALHLTRLWPGLFRLRGRGVGGEWITIPRRNVAYTIEKREKT